MFASLKAIRQLDPIYIAWLSYRTYLYLNACLIMCLCRVSPCFAYVIVFLWCETMSWFVEPALIASKFLRCSSLVDRFVLLPCRRLIGWLASETFRNISMCRLDTKLKLYDLRLFLLEPTRKSIRRIICSVYNTQ